MSYFLHTQRTKYYSRPFVPGEDHVYSHRHISGATTKTLQTDIENSFNIFNGFKLLPATVSRRNEQINRVKYFDPTPENNF